MNAAEIEVEDARSAAMDERSRYHLNHAEHHAETLQEALRKEQVARRFLLSLLALHGREQARCESLGCRPGTLEQTLLRYEIVTPGALRLSLNREASN